VAVVACELPEWGSGFEAGVFLAGALDSIAEVEPAGRIGRVADDSVGGPGVEGREPRQGFAQMDLLIVLGHRWSFRSGMVWVRNRAPASVSEPGPPPRRSWCSAAVTGQIAARVAEVAMTVRR